MSSNSPEPPLLRGPWSSTEVAAYLRATVAPLRLAFPTSSGFPAIVSLWFLYDHPHFWCAVPSSSFVARCIVEDSRCAFEVATNEPPYRGLRGRALVRVAAREGEAVLRQLIDRYLGDDESRLAQWLLSRKGNEVALRPEPVVMTCWDYTERMLEGAETA